jgi:hypothetical protein
MLTGSPTSCIGARSGVATTLIIYVATGDAVTRIISKWSRIWRTSGVASEASSQPTARKTIPTTKRTPTLISMAGANAGRVVAKECVAPRDSAVGSYAGHLEDLYEAPVIPA